MNRTEQDTGPASFSMTATEDWVSESEIFAKERDSVCALVLWRQTGEAMALINVLCFPSLHISFYAG